MPTESRSPWVRLRILLSWYAVARAIETARAGSPRRTPIAAIRDAFSAWSGSRSTVRVATVAVQPGGSGSGPVPRHTATITPATTATIARNRTMPERRCPRVLLVGMQICVERDALRAPRHRLDGAGDRVAAEQHVVRSGELGRLDHLGLVVDVAHGHLGAGRDVA